MVVFSLNLGKHTLPQAERLRTSEADSGQSNSGIEIRGTLLVCGCKIGDERVMDNGIVMLSSMTKRSRKLTKMTTTFLREHEHNEKKHTPISPGKSLSDGTLAIIQT